MIFTRYLFYNFYNFSAALQSEDCYKEFNYAINLLSLSRYSLGFDLARIFTNLTIELLRHLQLNLILGCLNTQYYYPQCC